MLCKAITIQPNEDFLGEIRLDLAELLLDNEQLKEGLIELTKYKKHREEKGWKTPERFQILFSKVSDIECSSLDNKTVISHPISPFYPQSYNIANILPQASQE